MGATPTESIRAAEERLHIARDGLKDMDDPRRARAGLYNAVVFARMVTFALQNMKNQTEGFSEWYSPIEADLRSDELAKFFSNLRTKIEKTAKQNTGSFLQIDSLSGSEIFKLANSSQRPPGAKNFFMGDQNGGSGWEVQLADGTRENYYVDLPPAWKVQSGLTLPDAPVQFRQTDARELLQRYLDKLAAIVEDAKKRFL